MSVLIQSGRQNQPAILTSRMLLRIRRMYVASIQVWTSTKTWNAHNAIFIMRVLTICHVKHTQRKALEKKRFDLRSLSPILCNLWLVLAYLKSLCVGNTRYPGVV